MLPSAPPTEREREYTPIGGPHPVIVLGVFASYWQRSRVYVVRLSCEFPYAVGVRKNTAQIYYKQSEKAKEKDRRHQQLRYAFRRGFEGLDCVRLL